MQALGTAAAESLWLSLSSLNDRYHEALRKSTRAAAALYNLEAALDQEASNTVFLSQVWRDQTRIHLLKRATEDNVADPLTKFVTKSILAKLFPLIGVRSHARFTHCVRCSPVRCKALTPTPFEDLLAAVFW